MKKATTSSLISPTSGDHSRHSKPGHVGPKSDISKSNVVKNGWIYCSKCGTQFKFIAGYKAHYESLHYTENKIAEVEDEDEDDDDDDIEYEEYWLDGGECELEADLYSERAMDYLNNEVEEGKKYELVENGPYHAKAISRGPISHFNFKAKERDNPGAQVETFFVQARTNGRFVIDCCVSLGPSQELPPYGKAYLDGCGYCRDMVHHPVKRCAKLIRGVEGDDVSWLYGHK